MRIQFAERAAIPDTNIGPSAAFEADQVSLGPDRLWFQSGWLHRLIAVSRVARLVTMGAMARLELALLRGHKEPRTLAAIRRARRGAESLLSGNEAFALYSLAGAQAALPGEMAEVGVYQGVSARIIAAASGGVPLHLFDTFAGLPEPDGAERTQLHAGQYAVSLPRVMAFLAGSENVSFHPGLFSERSASAVRDRRFSFVHLDVDLESSTTACLEFFYPRMLPGGIILTHDYSYLPGVRSAFSAFLAHRPERAIELPTSQAMVVKLP